VERDAVVGVDAEESTEEDPLAEYREDGSAEDAGDGRRYLAGVSGWTRGCVDPGLGVGDGPSVTEQRREDGSGGTAVPGVEEECGGGGVLWVAAADEGRPELGGRW